MTSTAAAIGAQGKQGGQQAAQVPFLLGSNRYTEAPFFTFTAQMGATQQAITPVPQVTPGNFLDGITIAISSTGGVLPTAGSLTQNGVLNVLNSLSFVNTNGGEILYPMGLFEYTMAQKYLRPWAGDPQKRAGFSNSINPAVVVELAIGVKDTLAILSNTDARAQYRFRGFLAPTTSLATGATTAPTVTVQGWLNSWKQPPAQDYAGRSITPFPPGLGVSRKLMEQTINVPASGTLTAQLTLTGDEIRGLILICRNSSGTRVDLTDANAGPILFRLDNDIQWTALPSQIVEAMESFYSHYFGSGNLNRETGLYVIPRFRSPNGGDAWLPTVEQSYLSIQMGSADFAGGTLEVIYDQLAVGVPLPPSLESI